MNLYQVVSLNHGTVFKRASGDIMMKLMNPDMPRLAKVSAYPVWAADIGNGHIEYLEPSELVEVVRKSAYDLIMDKSTPT